MLKGLRWPLLVLVLAAGLLVLSITTRPEKEKESPGTAPEPTATVQPTQTPEPLAAALASQPTLEFTPAPTLAPPNILIEALVGQIHKLNPLLAAYNPVDRDITSLIFEGLTTTNDYGEIVPDLAASWQISADGLEYIVVLRDDVLWQDGVPFTAEDVAFTIDLISDPDFPGPASLRDFWRTVEVDALASTLVRFRLTQPLASFTDQLQIGIVPAHVLQGISAAQLEQHPFNLSPIGTGPYQIETLTASGGQIDGIQLRVAPVYRQRPEGGQGYLLDRIIFRTYPTTEAALDAFQRGEVNSIGSLPSGLRASAQQIPGLSIYSAVAPRLGVLIYNWKRSSVRFVRNPRVRLALAQSIDRTALVNEDLRGQAVPADSPLLPNSWAYEAGLHWPAYNLDEARHMLETANFVFDTVAPAADQTAVPDGAESVTPEGTAEPTQEATAEPTPAPDEQAVEFALTILTLDDPALVALADGIASGWQQIGFKVSVEAVDAASLQIRLEAGDFDCALIELDFEPNADPDPYVFWHQGQYGVGQNYGGMDDRRISEALENARREPVGLNRLVYYQRFQELFAERVPALILYHPLYTYAAATRLSGIQLGFISTPSDRFRHIQDWAFTQ